MPHYFLAKFYDDDGDGMQRLQYGIENNVWMMN